MTASTSTTVSPCRPRMARKTPWADGCCGPIFICRRSGPAQSISTRVVLFTSSIGGVTLSIGWMRRVHRIRLEERMAFPAVLEQDAPQVRVVVEANPEQVEALALHPVRAAVDRRQRGAVGDAGTEPGPQHQRNPFVEVVHAGDDFEALLLPVHRGEEVEEAAAERLLRLARGV